jgi:hypothetical protein
MFNCFHINKLFSFQHLHLRNINELHLLSGEVVSL